MTKRAPHHLHLAAGEPSLCRPRGRHRSVEPAVWASLPAEKRCHRCEKLASAAPADLPEPAAEPIYRREAHAAHYGTGRVAGTPAGHDIESWDVTAPTYQGGAVLRPEGVPADAVWARGYRDDAGLQHWIWERLATLTPGTCSRCS